MTTSNTLSDTLEFNQRSVTWLRLLLIVLCLGRAWQGLFWDLPLRTFFWDQSLLQGTVEWLTGDTWQNYVTNRSINIDYWINCLGVFMGVFWLLSASLVAFIQAKHRWGKWVLNLLTLSFFILAVLYFKEKFWQVGQLLEYSLQVGAPLIFGHVIYNGKNTAAFRRTLKILVAICFTCHGLYAFGYYPQPGVWVQWCMRIYGFSDDATAILFLKIIGVIDFIAAALIFWRPTFTIAVWYCVIWGTMTALARIVANYYSTMGVASLHQHSYETLYRLVHGGIPFLLWYWQRAAEQGKGTVES